MLVKPFAIRDLSLIFASAKEKAEMAQLVEQRIRNA